MFAADDQGRHRHAGQAEVAGTQRIDEDLPAATTARRRGGREQVVDKRGNARVSVGTDRQHRDQFPSRPPHRARYWERAERRDQTSCCQNAGRRQSPRDRKQVHLAQQVAGGGVDQCDGVGALLDLVAVPVRPGSDGDTAHRVSGDNGALVRAEGGLEDGIEIGRQVIQAVAPRRGTPLRPCPWPRWSNAITRYSVASSAIWYAHTRIAQVMPCASTIG